MYLAIDAGGTKTDYVLADGQTVLARVRGGCIKRMRVDEATATANLDESLGQMAEAATLRQVVCTCVGTAGETVPLVTDWLRASLSARVGGELVLVGDVEVALDAAFEGGPGVLVLAGTGSNVAGRHEDGSLLGAGGWGPLMADQGSGNRLGLAGLRAGFLARDEGRPTRLLAEAARFWGLASEDDLVAYANSAPPPDFSQLSRSFHQLALEGDAVAREVLEREGQDLGYLVRLVIRRIVARRREPGETGAPWPRIAFAGSVMEHVPMVRAALLAAVGAEFAGVQELPGVVDPVMGALWRARQAGRQL